MLVVDLRRFRSAILLSLLVFGAWSSCDEAAAYVGGICGNGVVEAGEACDSGSALGAPDCNTLCQQIEFEDWELPFEPGLNEPSGPSRRVSTTKLQCRSSEVRAGARNWSPVRVRYRIHLCRTRQGVDAFTPEQIRAVMAQAKAEFALGGVVLEEESLVRFTEDDCEVILGDTDWSDPLEANTPPGVLAVGFFKGISNDTSQFTIGGFCRFGGPLCVNAGVFDSLVIHELGHFFGLLHTFECAYGVETAETCEVDGDLTCDTPPDRGPVGSNGIARCADTSLLNGSCKGSCGNKLCTDGSAPDGYNWMSYYDCMPGHFSPEQQDFVRCTLGEELIAFNADAPASTTTTSTTSTTLFEPTCGDANGDGKVTTGDALVVLRVAVGSGECPLWQCDYDGSGMVGAADALGVLRASVGAGTDGSCPTAS